MDRRHRDVEAMAALSRHFGAGVKTAQMPDQRQQAIEITWQNNNLSSSVRRTELNKKSKLKAKLIQINSN